MTQPYDAPPIEYATARRERHSGIAGGIALMGAGLGLILLGGCFLIGVIALHGQQVLLQYGSYSQWPLPLIVLPWVFYVLAFGCFAGAVWMLAAGVRWLYRTAA